MKMCRFGLCGDKTAQKLPERTGALGRIVFEQLRPGIQIPGEQRDRFAVLASWPSQVPHSSWTHPLVERSGSLWLCASNCDLVGEYRTCSFSSKLQTLNAERSLPYGPDTIDLSRYVSQHLPILFVP